MEREVLGHDDEVLMEAQALVWQAARWIFLWSQKWYVATGTESRGRFHHAVRDVGRDLRDVEVDPKQID
ncbi:MAG: hypothetical protein ACRDGN_07545 [bacterium]